LEKVTFFIIIQFKALKFRIGCV